MVNQKGRPGKPEGYSPDLLIKKHGRQFRAVISVPLIVGVDDDIIEDLNNLPTEQRQAAIKNAIRAGRPYLAPVQIEQSDIVNGLRQIFEQGERTHSLLEQLRVPIEWIEQQFGLLHKYLEEKFKKVSRVSVGSPFEPTEESTEDEQKATQEQQDKRKANARKQKWG